MQWKAKLASMVGLHKYSKMFECSYAAINKGVIASLILKLGGHKPAHPKPLTGAQAGAGEVKIVGSSISIKGPLLYEAPHTPKPKLSTP